MTQRALIDYEQDGQAVSAVAAWRVLEHFADQADEAVLESVRKRLPVALKDFPALAHETWHELGHVAIRVRYENDEDVAKTSEEFCSIYSVARMPPEAIDEDRIPYLGEPTVSQEKWPEMCRRALGYRETKRNYIQKCKEWLQI